MGIQKAEARMPGNEKNRGVCGKQDIGISYIGIYSVRAGIILNAGFRPLYVCV